jgi:hypothetical protein
MEVVPPDEMAPEHPRITSLVEADSRTILGLS